MLHRYFSDIKIEDLKAHPSGVRAQAIDKNGNLIHDFLFKESNRSLHACNVPSPAATSSIPIGRYIADKCISKLR